MSNEIVKHPVAFNNSLASAVNYINTKTQVKFDDSCLKQGKVTFIHKKVDNIFLVYEINLLPFNVGKDFAFKGSLFWAVKLTKIADPDKYKYSGHGTGFDARARFLLSDGNRFGKNVVIFDADMSSLVYTNNKKKYILILGKSTPDDLDYTTLTSLTI